MGSGYYRSLSPGRHQYLDDPMRASTGMMHLGSSYDPYEIPRSRDGYDGYPSDVPHRNSSTRLPSRRLEAQPVSSQTYRDPGQSTKRRTEYNVRPRPRSNTLETPDQYDTPVRLAVPSSSSHRRPSPVATSGLHHSPSPSPRDSGQYLVPASTRDGGRHRRVYSTDYASDTGRPHPYDADQRTGHRGYRVHQRNHRPHPAYEGMRKGEDLDDYDAYSYTTPREQFDVDYPVRTSQRAPRRKERPLSMTEMDDPPPWLVRSKEPRSHGPPPSYRGFDKLDPEHEGRPRNSAYGADDGHAASRSKRGPYDHALVPVHHDSDEGYSSHPERYSRHHSRRDPPRSHHKGDHDRYADDRPSRRHTDLDRLAPGLGTVALAGGAYSDMEDYDHHSSRRSRRNSRGYDRDYGRVKPPSREPDSPEHNKQLYLEPGSSHDRSRPSRRSRKTAESESETYTSDEDLRNYRREPSASERRRHSSTDSSSEADRSSRRTRDRSSHRRRPSGPERPSDDGHSHDARHSPSVDDKPRRPIAVEPPSFKEPEAARKGILKAPRPSFPEERNPVREGVAPLKDAHDQGIPPGARWTKIDRRLVNPAALEIGNERFEERSDYVIVLRVLSKEEIQAYAIKTKEIRDTRHQESVRDRRRHRDESRRRGQRPDESSSDSDDEDEEEEAPKAIEAPPQPTSEQDKLSLPLRPRASSHTATESERPRMSSSTVPADGGSH
ncbi:hypothetical protein N7510_003339 [Penicillium lagena]|uniref:uncharacterized protein n=1 Tax=Penicillium lagena TaxID=94218 RepID=UPI0025406DF1|nr:uncharacterized protein N7510_003339 [Penicillium lagena]KAJ5619355.1 hypothetical protein N7510_003339 [Penicillium lagena]